MLPRVILKGTMVKKSQQKKMISPENYKERFFVLDTNELKYSERRTGKKPVLKGSIDLRKISCADIVNTDLNIPFSYKYPFQVFYSNTYLYVFAPDNNCRMQWVTALKEETQHNNLVSTFHPSMWMEGKWRCCQSTDRQAVGCKPYDPGTLANEKGSPHAPNTKVTQYETDKRTVVAIQDYAPIDQDDLPLLKHQKYILIDDSDLDWWTVQNFEGKKGFVPSVLVAGKFETHFDRFEWYNKNVTSKDAMELLSKEGKEGSFMVRKSVTSDFYIVYVFSSAPGAKAGNNSNVWQYRIKQRKDSDSQFYVTDKFFSTVPELIHYHQHDSAGMVTRLRHPVSNERFSVAVADHSEGQWQLDPLELTLEESIGSGQFGLVMRGKWRDKKVAVKMIKEGSMSEDEFKEEAKVMMKLCHCKLVQLYGVCTQRSPICLVCEFMEKGALLDYLKTKKGQLSKEKMLGMCLDVCEGMTYLENSNFIHRDLAARNCLVSQDGCVKVADFGMARFILDDEYTPSQGSKFPIRWSAPEIISYGKYSSKSDVWSFGVLMWEVYSEGNLPYGRQNNTQVVDFVRRRQRLRKPALAPEDVNVLMKWCWKEKEDDRPAFGQLLHELASLSHL